MHQSGFKGGDFRGGGLTKGDFDWENLPRRDFPVTNSLNGDPRLNMWE